MLGIGADDQGQLDIGQEIEQPVPPGRCAFLARRQISTLSIEAGKAKSHGHDRNAPLVVKCLPVHGYPRSQAISTGIIKRNSRPVNAGARRLAHNT